MDKIIYNQDVAEALRKLATAIEEGKATDAVAQCELAFQDVGVVSGVGFVRMGQVPTGEVLMTVRFKPEKIGE